MTDSTDKPAPGERSPPAWVLPFLGGLRAGKSVTAAAHAAGINAAAAYTRRGRNPQFAREWAACNAPDGRRTPRGGAPAAPRAPRNSTKLARFLEALAETSNVSAAAAASGLTAGAIYRLRRENADFSRRWYAALAEGYDNLEMELLGRLRAGDGRGEAAVKDKDRFDTAAALRCLAAHRESVAREKGRRRLAEEVATIESINAKIDRMRRAAEDGKAAIDDARRENAARRRRAARAAAKLRAADGD